MQLHGLTAQQIEICNKLWGMETEDEVLEWFDTLPQNLKFEAHLILSLILLEQLDETVAQMSELEMIESQEVLSKFTL